jgi:katanin p60 ATPase-containing subunit A1
MRFDKKPKIVRKLLENEEPIRPNKSKSDNSKKVPTSSNNQTKPTGDNNKLPNLINPNSDQQDKDNNTSFSVSGTSINKTNKQVEDPNIKFEERVLKPPPQFGGDNDLKQLANVISKEIYQESPNVRFSDIIQLDEAKRLLIEAVQLPLRFPYLFTGILRPWRGFLLLLLLIIIIDF